MSFEAIYLFDFLQLKEGSKDLRIFSTVYFILLSPLTKLHAKENYKEKVNPGKSIIDTCSVPAACCATEYPDCSLLYSYPSEGWQVIGGNGADEEYTGHRC